MESLKRFRWRSSAIRFPFKLLRTLSKYENERETVPCFVFLNPWKNGAPAGGSRESSRRFDHEPQ